MINRYNLDSEFANECAYSGVVEAGDFVLVTFRCNRIQGAGEKR